MSKIRLSALVSVIIKVLIILFTAYSFAMFFFRGGEGNMQVRNWVALRYYTVLSNLFMAAIAAITLPAPIHELRLGEISPYRYAVVWGHIGTTCITVTLLVVMLFLGPLTSYGEMIAGPNLYMHLLTPVLALIDMMFFTRARNESGGRYTLPFINCVYAMLPTFLYGVVYMYQIIIAPALGKTGWPDFYCFNIGGMFPISAAIVLGLAFGSAVLLRAVHKRIQK